jgi:para-aminobenzoate synthetase/4-amino-4-deoxychorismate lyase
MEIIAVEEDAPRGVYCGAIGFMSPGGEAVFSVAIRTLVLDRVAGTATLGVGSGITFDSCPVAEYAEALGKAAFIRQGGEDFYLFETLRQDSAGLARMERHLTRLEDSAAYFGFPFSRARAVELLERLPAASEPVRVRLSLLPDGGFAVATLRLIPEREPLIVGLSAVKVESTDRLLYHKTSCRQWRDAARQGRPECDEVLFLNERGELTEGSYNTLVLVLDGRQVTPPLSSGLLPGVLRGELLDRGEVREQVLRPGDLELAEDIWLVNSLRGWRRAVLAEGEKLCDT